MGNGSNKNKYRTIKIPEAIKYKVQTDQGIEEREANFVDVVFNSFLTNKAFGRSIDTVELAEQIVNAMNNAVDGQFVISEVAYSLLKDVACYPENIKGEPFIVHEARVVLPFLRAIKDAK